MAIQHKDWKRAEREIVKGLVAATMYPFSEAGINFDRRKSDERRDPKRDPGGRALLDRRKKQRREDNGPDKE